MPLNLRSVVAQVHRMSRSIGPRRNFGSSPDNLTELADGLGGVGVVPLIVTGGIGATMGYGLGYLLLDHFTHLSEVEQKLQELLRMYEESDRRRENMLSEVVYALYGRKS